MKTVLIIISITIASCSVSKPVAIKTKVPCQSKAGKAKKEYYNKLQYN